MAGPPTPSSGNSRGGEDATRAAFFAARQLLNERMMKMFVAGLCGLIGVFVFFHWARVLFVKLGRSWNGAAALERPFVVISRLVRNILVRKVPGFKSAGHALTVAAYVALNAAVSFTNIDLTSMGSLGNRFGWMALANMAFVVFLALKNTPLAFLTAYSYERLNCLHQVSGYMMFVFMVFHGAFYTAFFNGQNRLVSIFSQEEEIAAIVAGFSFLSVVFSAMFLRRIWYELFYVIHITAWIMGVVTVGVHLPTIAKKTLIVTLLTASMWVLDRIIRASRVLYNSFNNQATLHPLANGGTKIVFKKAPARAEPGKHCFIWIPAIRKFETHPFTIHKTEPMEFTVKAHNGFTRDLHKYAAANPGAAVTASVDGPYGTFPDPMEYDKIVLIAGGGGATFTFGLMVNILERMSEDARKKVSFIWAVKKHENLSWFQEHLEMLKSHEHEPHVDVSLFVTRAPSDSSVAGHLHLPHLHTAQSRSSSSDGGQSPPLSPAGDDVEKGAPQTSNGSHRAEVTEKEMERGIDTQVEHKETSEQVAVTTAAALAHPYQHAVKAGRPDLASLIREAVNTTPPNQRVLVAGCGPDPLMRVIRDTTAKLIRTDGPAVELHCEQFGW